MNRPIVDPAERVAPRTSGTGATLAEEAELAGSGAGPGSGRSARVWLAVAGSYAATVLFLVTVNFFLPRAMPGDPIQALQSRSSTTYVSNDQTRAELAEYYGLDRPLLEQYGAYLADLAHGDLGVSIATNAPVVDALSARLPWTLLLVGTALGLATAVGLVTGVQAGWRRGRAVDRGLIGLFLGLRELPAFLLGSLVLLAFAVKLDWFPLSGAETPFAASGGLVDRVADIGHHLVLPAAVLAVGVAADQYLVMRAGMVNELGADYLVLGRLKGLTERRLKYRYAARNALLPVVSVSALQVGAAVSTGVLVERVFAYPGVGNLIFESIGGRDYPTIQGAFLVISLLVVTANALADLAYRRLDPRTAA